ncbi:hypothetical protein BLNAU_14484 [Blattamonas nauphoetae]|uniref:Uncharacterized protein n=1 Tax=Blattamonas nauphoetae TaxID=2049346 RepID=A0ABQ9XJ03_9EUKA|nr:hypothetical protein BLNAU_14484 [Blattamonas nauphoetae]
MTALMSFVASKCEAKAVVEWKDLMEWFVCAVIGLDSKVSQTDEWFWFAPDELMVDECEITQLSSSPPHSPQSFSAAIVSLSKFFLSLLDQLTASNRLPHRVEDHFRDNLIPSVLRRLINHLFSTGTLIPICDQSKIDDLVNEMINSCLQSLPSTLGLSDTLIRMIGKIYDLVHQMEINNLTDTTVRLSGIDSESHPLKLRQFLRFYEPELIKISKQYDPTVFDDPRRIQFWKEFLNKVALGEEVVTDAYLPPNEVPTSVLVNKWIRDISYGTLPSSSHIKQKVLELLDILHPLIASSLNLSFLKHTQIKTVDRVQKYENPDPTERFDISIFDEADDELLAQSLVRCFSVCDLVGAEKCIRTLPTFFDRTVSLLGSSNFHVRETAYSLFTRLLETPSVIPLLPRLWNRLHSAFSDGWLEEQDALLRISVTWIHAIINGETLPMFPFDQFDWDGLFSADMRWSFLFCHSIELIMSLQRPWIEQQIGRAKVTQVIVSFEQHQLASSRINSEFDSIVINTSDDLIQILISYSLLMSFLFKSDFPIHLTNFLTTHLDLDVNILLPRRNHLTLFCHTSLNPHKPCQPPLDLIFERTLLSFPIAFFLNSTAIILQHMPSLLNTASIGLHALCRRGVHIGLFENETIQTGHHLNNSLELFLTPLIFNTFRLFLYYPPPLVVRFFLPILWRKPQINSWVDTLTTIIPALLLATAPFGDCFSLIELFQSTRLPSNTQLSPIDSDIATCCQTLEWLNIPTGFGSALAHSNTFLSQDSRTSDTPPTPPPDYLNHSSHMSFFRTNLPDLVTFLGHNFSTIGDIVHKLDLIRALFLVKKTGILSDLCFAMISRIPAEVSVALEAVKRLACVSKVGLLNVMVRWGVLDIVIRAVSESSFLEDYENGICVIGIFLRSIRSIRSKQEMVNHDFPGILSRTLLE